MSGEPKYAPARADGLKPWVVEIFDWGQYRTRIEYAATATEARSQVVSRRRPGFYVKKVSRATPKDMPS